MAKGDPLRAKEIFDSADELWFMRALAWRKENINAKVPDMIVGSYAKE